MELHIFHLSGYEPKTVIVKANDETEARGKAQKELPSGAIPPYEGTVEELMENKSENGILEL